MASGLTIGAGIARGAKSFMDSFMQGKMYQQQEQLMKHQVILSALYKNLEDDNIPYAQRAKIFDAIPGLMGIKLDAPLSQMMGLQDLLDDEVEVQSEIKATPAKAGTPAGTITDENAVASGLAGTISQEATQDVPAGIGREKVTEQFGDMSPARYKQLITSRQQDIDSEKALENYRRKAEIDFELQQNSYKAQGYNKVITEGFNSAGEYVVLMANASNDIKEVKMPKGFKPTKLLSKSGTKLPSMVVARTAYYSNEINPITGENYTPQEAEQMALTDYKKFGDKMFDVGVAGKEASTKSAELRNAGEMPRTQGEIEADKDRDEAREDRRATQVDTQYGILRDSNAQLPTIIQNKTSAETAHKQAVAARNAWIINNGSKEGEQGLIGNLLGSKPDYKGQVKLTVDGVNYYVDPEDLADDEYKVLNAEVDRTRVEVNNWNKEEGRVRGNIDSATQRIRSIESRAMKSGSSNSATVNVTPAQIQTFRKNNANNARVRNMSDDEIRELLIRNRNRWQP